MRLSLFRHDTRTIYQIIPIIAARTTGGESHTSMVKLTIEVIIHKLRSQMGKYENIYPKNTTKIVILKPLTAIKCVSPELLKSSFISGGIFSLAPSNIPHKNIRSSCVYKVSRIESKELRRS